MDRCPIALEEDLCGKLNDAGLMAKCCDLAEVREVGVIILRRWSGEFRGVEGVVCNCNADK
jgi:hypothetical protein